MRPCFAVEFLEGPLQQQLSGLSPPLCQCIGLIEEVNNEMISIQIATQTPQCQTATTLHRDVIYKVLPPACPELFACVSIRAIWAKQPLEHTDALTA